MKKTISVIFMLVLISSISFSYDSAESSEVSAVAAIVKTPKISAVSASNSEVVPVHAASQEVRVPTMTASYISYPVPNSLEDCIDEELNNELKILYSKLTDVEASGDYEQMTVMKSRIENLSVQIRERKMNCVSSVQQFRYTDPCIDYGLNEELTRLSFQLREAEEIGNDDMASAIIAKKEEIIRLMRENRERCLAEKPVSPEATQASSVLAVRAISACSNLENYRSRIAYLEKIASNPEDFDISQEKADEIKSELNVLREQAARYSIECNDNVKTNLGSMVSEAVKEDAGSGDIIAYYKARLSEIISSDSGSQIEQLKQLRDEIDSLIRQLLESRQRIDAQGINEVVSEVKITPGKIEADNIEVRTESKNIMVKVNNELAEIASNATSLSLDSDGVSAYARELRIENSTLMVGNSEISILPSHIIGIINAVPRKIEIVEENSSAVYRVNADENRRLFGLFSMLVEKKIKVDGSSGAIISQEMPWWAFLTTPGS